MSNAIRKFKKWDIVIHSADAKKRDMLMIVVGHTKSGLVKTRYVTSNETNGWSREVFENEEKHLRNPKDYGIEI